MPSVLCIAGLDPSGYSGLSADARALDFLGVGCLPVASVLTVQNAQTFSEVQPVPGEIISKQVDAVFEGEVPGAIKVGMLGSADQVRLVADILTARNVRSVVDPVFSSSTGFSVLDDDILDAYRHDLLPVAALATPNAFEAEALTGIKVDGPDAAEEACRRILDLGPGAVLVKGGHLEKGRGTDILGDGKGIRRLQGTKVRGSVRGTGCTYSSLIAGHLALGFGMPEAVEKSKGILAEAISNSVKAKSLKLCLGRLSQGGEK